MQRWSCQNVKGQAATRPFVAKSGLPPNLSLRRLAAGRACRPASTGSGCSPCLSSSHNSQSFRWIPRAAQSRPEDAVSGRDDCPAGPRPAAPATSCSPRGPLVSELAPSSRSSWWESLTSLIVSAGRVAALALVVVSLVLASPSAALAKGSGGRGGGRCGRSSGSSSRSYGSSSGGGWSSSSGGSGSSRGSYSRSALGASSGGFDVFRDMMFPSRHIHVSLSGPSAGGSAATVRDDSYSDAVAQATKLVVGLFVLALFIVALTWEDAASSDRAALGTLGRSSGSSSSGVWGSSPGRAAREPVALCRVQVAVLASAREELQTKLGTLVEEADTRTEQGLCTLLHESALLLMRHREAFAYGGVQEAAVAGEAEAEAGFNLLSIAERSRFKEETLSNVQGRKQRAATGTAGGRRPEEENELVVVTLLLSARPTLPSQQQGPLPAAAGAAASLLGVRSAAAVRGPGGGSSQHDAGGASGVWPGVLGGLGNTGGRTQVAVEGEGAEAGWVEQLDGAQGLGRALLALSGVRADQMLAVEVLWTPEQAGDTFSRADLLADYPHLQPL
ncbi:hypothetical protein HXX76_009148 [Chlamydomonas incerta]|uniref:Uncharacterized protein n=1 Tax=Chlamydomonas incerta TaxID=51695 RepID=A0A835T1R8_CHLIN|nr:hypothetical protein HXX76_009148 [Chlamydomonas incerta]|eukprot:KAG2432229.1 hypothetical protein HXX76_009148 [Chlamydomonas incerta]